MAGFVKMGRGVVVAADLDQEWLLPWWWKHYSYHNNDPVLFIDFGMSSRARAWCERRGICRSVAALDFPVHKRSDLPKERQEAWERRYGKRIWDVRSAWLKKPFALLEVPFDEAIWLDLDCQVRGSLEPIFKMLESGADLAIAKERWQVCEFLFPNEAYYNSGVIAFRKQAPIVKQWAETTVAWQSHLPADQEFLTRAIFLHEPHLLELPPHCNWYWVWGANEMALIHHFCGRSGKIELLRSWNVSPSELQLDAPGLGQ